MDEGGDMGKERKREREGSQGVKGKKTIMREESEEWPKVRSASGGSGNFGTTMIGSRILGCKDMVKMLRSSFRPIFQRTRA